jgi:hypothetical protein
MQDAYNLGQVQRVIANGIENQVLELVDGGEQVLAEGGHDFGCGWCRTQQ